MLNDMMPCAGLSLLIEEKERMLAAGKQNISCPRQGIRLCRAATAEKDYSDFFSPEEFNYLNTEADEFGWYVWTDKTRDIIGALCARGCMAANGDFKVVREGRESKTLSGTQAPRSHRNRVRYYELIGEGCVAFQALRRAQIGAAAHSRRSGP